MIAAAGFIMMNEITHEVVFLSHCWPQSVRAAEAANGMIPATSGRIASLHSIIAN